MGALLAVSSPASRGRASGPSLLAARPCPPPASPERSSDLCHRGINFTSRGVLPGTPAMCESARCKIKRPSRKECLQFESIAVTALLHNTGLGHLTPFEPFSLSLRKVKERTNRKYTQQRGTLHRTHSEAEEFVCCVLSCHISYELASHFLTHANQNKRHHKKALNHPNASPQAHAHARTCHYSVSTVLRPCCEQSRVRVHGSSTRLADTHRYELRGQAGRGVASACAQSKTRCRGISCRCPAGAGPAARSLL